MSDAQLAAINISRHAFHGDWNYRSCPINQSAAVEKLELTYLFKDRP